MRVRLCHVVLLVLALVVPVWSSTTNHSLPHSLTPVLGSSECINKESREHFSLTASILQVGEEVGVPLSHSHCFTHQMTAHSAHFRAGDVWEICVDDSSPPVSLITHPEEKLTAQGISDTSSLPAPPRSDDAVPLDSSFEEHHLLASSPGAVVLSKVDSTSSNMVVIYVKAEVPDTITPNATACNPNGDTTSCNLRSAVLYCEDFLTTPGRECAISLPPMGELTLDPFKGELQLDLVRGVLRVEGNACRLRPMFSSTNSTRLFRVIDSAELHDFVFTMSNMTISGFGSDSWDGGAVYMESISVAIDNVLFESNAGLAGGALCFHKCKAVDVLYSEFVNNTAASDGGGVYFSVDHVDVNILSCQFIGNTVLSTTLSPIGTGLFMGGGMSVKEGNDDFDIASCLFENNTALRGGGLSFYFSNSNVNISRSAFIRNTAIDQAGGVEFSLSNTDILIRECEFIRNVASTTSGGLRFFDGNVGIDINDCVFRNNEALDNGGGIYFFSYNVYVSLSGILFDSNLLSRGVYGGAGLYLGNVNGYFDISSCIFFRNTAQSGGGALRIAFQNYVIELSQCTFKENIIVTSGNGGGLQVDHDNTVSLLDINFIQNTASLGSGGGAYFSSRNSGTICERLFFKDNVAGSSGGALSFVTDHMDTMISNSTFIRNIAGAAGAVGGGNGGALHVDNDNGVVLRDLIFIGNNATQGNGGAVYFNSRNADSLCEDLVFIENFAGSSGGALTFLTDNPNIVVRRCTFRGNTAGISGGALYSALGNSGLIIVDSTFSHNSVNLYGGAIYFGEHHVGPLIVLNTLIEFNTAHDAGGIFVFSFNDRILLDGCTLRYNEAINHPGAFLSMAWDVVIDNSTISGNVAGHNYGGVYIEEALEGVIKNTVVSNNSAIGEFVSRIADVNVFGCGGIGLFNSDNVGLDNCTLDFNYANLFGGAICVILSGTIAIRNTIMRGNVALSGGAVEVNSCHDIRFDNVLVQDSTAGGPGGGVYVTWSTDVRVANSSFVRNAATAGSGSAVYIMHSSTHLENNWFDANEAPTGAGTVFWHYDQDGRTSEPIGLRNASNEFTTSNFAAYGELWATGPVKLVASSDAELRYDDTIAIVDYDNFIPSIILSLQDFYSQPVLTENEGFAQLTVPTDFHQDCGTTFHGNIGGGIVEQFKEGVANFSEVDAFCRPGGALLLSGVSNLVLDSAEVELSFRPCAVGEFFADRICSPCPDGTYSFTDPSTVLSLTTDLSSSVCQRCPPGADHCFRDQILLTEGHWRINRTAESVLKCPWGKGSCLGGPHTGDVSCGSLYQGPLCAVCKDDYFYMESTDECTSCGDTSSWFDPFTICVIVVVFVCLATGGYRLNLMMREQELQSMTELLIYSILKLKLVDMEMYVNAPLAVNENILILTRRLRALLKMYITFFQVVTSIPSVLHFYDFPDGFKSRMIELSSVVNIGVSRSAIFNCLLGWSFDFVDQLLLVTIYPAVVLLLFVVVCRLHVYLKLERNPTTSKSSAAYISEAGVVRAKYVEFFLFFTYLILPSVVVTIFETFRCQDVDPDDVSAGGDSYLRQDYSISCHSSRYHFAVAWAVIMIFVYVLGVPAFYFFLLYSRRSAIMTRDLTAVLVDERGNSVKQQQLSAIRILFDSYKPCFWYWELVETGFRLSITGFLVLGVYAGDNAQMVMGIGLAIVFTKLYEYFEPFLDEISQSSKVVTLWEISLIFFLFILMKAEFMSEYGIVVVASLLVVSVFLNMCLALFRILRQFSEDTSAHNLEALGERDRSISGAASLNGDDMSERGSRPRVTTVVFSPFDVEGQLTRKEIKI